MSNLIYWTLEQDGVEQTFEQWGFGKLTRARTSQDIDWVTFEQISQTAATDSPSLLADDIAIIRRNRTTSDLKTFSGGERWFYGPVLDTPRAGSGSDESLRYKVAGPWWHLDNKVYEQPWLIFASLTTQPAGVEGVDWMKNSKGWYFTIVWTPHAILNQMLNATVGPYFKISTGQQIVDAVNYCINNGAPIILGDEFPTYDPLRPSAGMTIDQAMAMTTGCPNADVPLDEALSVTCAEVIKRMLRWSPDACTWFDYRTEPYPTLHCKVRASLDSVTLDADPSLAIIESIDVTPRYDLRPPSVRIRFETTTTVGSSTFVGVEEQHAPDPLPPATERFSEHYGIVQLTGPQWSSGQYAYVYTTPYATALTDKNFWMERDGFLKNIGPSNFQIVGTPARDPAKSGYAYFLNTQSAPLADWMGYQSEDETVSAEMAWEVAESSERRTSSATLTSTNAPTGLYTSTQLTFGGEPIPMNMAQAIWNSVKDLQYSGHIAFADTECPEYLDMGNTFNVVNGASEWASMNACIQRISEDVDQGTVKVEFGPPAHLTESDLISLIRVYRARFVSYSMFVRTGSPLGGGGAMSLGSAQAQSNGTSSPSNTVPGISALISQTMSNPADSVNYGTSTINTYNIVTPENGAQAARIRRVHYTDAPSGTPQLFLALATVPHTDVATDPTDENNTPDDIFLGGGSGGEAKMFLLVSADGNFIEGAPTDDGVTPNGSSNVWIAKNPISRPSTTSISLDGVTYSFSYSDDTSGSVNNELRTKTYTVSGTTVTEKQKVNPPWRSGELIYAVPAETDLIVMGDPDVDVTWIALGARTWQTIMQETPICIGNVPKYVQLPRSEYYTHS